MSRRIVAAAAALLLGAVLDVPAHAAVTQPAGPLCSFGYTEIGGQTQLRFRAGPLRVVDEDDPAVVHTATVTCTIVEASTGSTHAAPAWATATSDPLAGHAYLPPTEQTVAGSVPDYYLLCTRVDYDGGTLYWHRPEDRNVDPAWSTSPSASCQRNTTTLESRDSDFPLRLDETLLATAGGELDTVMRVLLWWCEYPSTWSSISFVRAAAAGAVVRTLPYGWTCTDAHTGSPVTPGSPLTTPDPGVSCLPPAAYPVDCDWLQVSGAIVPVTLGRVGITSACGTDAVTRWLVPVQGLLAEAWSGRYDRGGLPPWRCTADEDTTGEPAYTVLCTVVDRYDD